VRSFDDPQSSNNGCGQGLHLSAVPDLIDRPALESMLHLVLLIALHAIVLHAVVRHFARLAGFLLLGGRLRTLIGSVVILHVVVGHVVVLHAIAGLRLVLAILLHVVLRKPTQRTGQHAHGHDAQYFLLHSSSFVSELAATHRQPDDHICHSPV